jgi:hypothetical protein
MHCLTEIQLESQDEDEDEEESDPDNNCSPPHSMLQVNMSFLLD